MNLKEKIAKIESEIENGLKFKATDRLRNLIQENPNETELWNRLAELYYESGFLDSAGKYWILTEQTDERIKKCVDIYEKSVNYSGNKILQDLKFRGDKKILYEFAQKKLTELESDSKNKTNYVPEFAPKRNKKKNRNKDYKETFNDKLGRVVFFGIIISIGLLIIIGIITVVNWIF